jgi:hypothetical protein
MIRWYEWPIALPIAVVAFMVRFTLGLFGLWRRQG